MLRYALLRYALLRFATRLWNVVDKTVNDRTGKLTLVFCVFQCQGCTAGFVRDGSSCAE
jgi:hypothetical protein